MSGNGRKFSLVKEPWVTVLTDAGDTKDVSLLELFHNARSIKRISGEMNCQDVAVLRFLVSLVYRACDPLTYDVWKNLWFDIDNVSGGGALSDAISKYLQLNDDRFYLFDDDRPFYQVHDLVPNKIWPPTALMQYPTSANDLFRNPHEKEINHISYAEAARWVLSSNMYDVCGIHTSYAGDPYAKAGKTFPPVAFGALGSIIHINGNNLYETLLLNSVPIDMGIFNAPRMRSGRRFTCGVPSYEHDDVRPDETYSSKKRSETMRRPDSVAESLTWMSRSIRLFESDAEAVTGCIVTNGRGADISNAYGVEPMFAFRENKDGDFVPVTYGSDVSIITSLAPLISINDSSSRRPGTIEFMAMLQNDEIIDDAMIQGIEVDTIVYSDSKKSKISGEFSCSINIPPSSISNTGACDVIVRGAEIMKEMVDLYGTFYRSSIVARGIKQRFKDIPHTMVNDAKSEVYSRLITQFYHWSASIEINTAQDVNDAINTLHSIVYKTIIDKTNDIVAHSDSMALIGRVVDDKSVSVIRSLNSLRKKLNAVINNGSVYEKGTR